MEVRNNRGEALKGGHVCMPTTVIVKQQLQLRSAHPADATTRPSPAVASSKGRLQPVSSRWTSLPHMICAPLNHSSRCFATMP
jgi:hypothetical protein